MAIRSEALPDVPSRTGSPLKMQACELFDRLVMHGLPVQVDDEQDIILLRMLVTAGLAKANISDGRRAPEGASSEPPATVTALTLEGFRWRKRQGQPPSYSILGPAPP